MLKKTIRYNRPRPDFSNGPPSPDLKVTQLTGDPVIPCAHVYMEAQIFSPDFKMFLLERSGKAHQPARDDPEHQYLLCNLGNGCELIPVTEERNAIAPSFGPDGRWIYYLVDEGRPEGGNVVLKRVRPDGTERETLRVIDTPLPGTNGMLRQIYPLSTISSDGRHLVTSGIMGKDSANRVLWGFVRFDLPEGTIEAFPLDSYFLNAHPQYCRSSEPSKIRDLLLQQNHGDRWDSGTMRKASDMTDPLGADIHVMRDDAARLRAMPWGRNRSEQCQGHQCWRGTSSWAITSTVTFLDKEKVECRLIESLPVDHDGHLGLHTPGGIRNDLSREFSNPQFYHFATDLAGRRLITDYWHPDGRTLVYLADLDKPGESPAKNFRCLLDTRSSRNKDAHVHPFLSPDGSRAFFNSDETGIVQAYLVEWF